MNESVTVSSLDIKNYHEFCTKHDLRAYSMMDLAMRMNITMNQLRYSLHSMIDDFPTEFIAFHCEEENFLKQKIG